MPEHPNAELVRRGYDAFIAGDMEWMNEHLHENFVWHTPGNNVFSGDYRGRENVLAFFARQAQHTRPSFDIHAVLADEDHAVVLSSVRVTRLDNQETYDSRFVHIFHVSGDQALESWIFNEDQAGLDAFLEGVRA